MTEHNDSDISAAAWSRRQLLLSGAVVSVAAAVGVALGRRALAQPAVAAAPQDKTAGATVQIENFSADGKSTGTVQLPRVVKSEAEWRAQLSPRSFEVTRQAGTEAPFSGEYAENHALGLYRCICCDTALYDSRTKFESGTGWPSFYRAISHYNVLETGDSSLGMQRTAVSCARCEAHLGHVFDDGPAPTGLRYCMNSVALRFVAHA